MVGRNSDMCRTIFNQLQGAGEHANDSRVFVFVGMTTELSIKLPIQLIRAVDEMNDHDLEPRR